MRSGRKRRRPDLARGRRRSTAAVGAAAARLIGGAAAPGVAAALLIGMAAAPGAAPAGTGVPGRQELPPIVTRAPLLARVTAAAVVGRTPLVRGELVPVAVEVRVGDGFHVNANPASAEFLIPTTVTFPDAEDIAIESVHYPEAELKSFGFWPEPLRVWEGSVVVGARIRALEGTAPGPRDLRFVVRYQACDELACFAPAEASYDVPVEVVEAGTPSRAVKSPLLDRARFVDPKRPH